MYVLSRSYVVTGNPVERLPAGILQLLEVLYIKSEVDERFWPHRSLANRPKSRHGSNKT